MVDMVGGFGRGCRRRLMRGRPRGDIVRELDCRIRRWEHLDGWESALKLWGSIMRINHQKFLNSEIRLSFFTALTLLSPKTRLIPGDGELIGVLTNFRRR
jgi:hypothetical protein